jgi:hypothetical protein
MVTTIIRNQSSLNYGKDERVIKLYFTLLYFTLLYFTFYALNWGREEIKFWT